MNRPLRFFDSLHPHIQDAIALFLGVTILAVILGGTIAIDYGFVAAFCDRDPVYFGKQGFVCPDAFAPAVKP